MKKGNKETWIENTSTRLAIAKIQQERAAKNPLPDDQDEQNSIEK